MTEPRAPFRMTPFGWLMLFLVLMLLAGIATLILGLQPPPIAQPLPYIV